MRIMAVDYGDAHTGVAISDAAANLVGFTTVVHGYRPAKVADQIAALAAEHGVEMLVLGYPVNMNGTPSLRAGQYLDMRDLLKERTGLPIILWNEWRTTIEAHQILFDAGKDGRKRKKIVDAVAASLILEGYLTYRRSQANRPAED